MADTVFFCAYKTFLVSGEKKSDKAHVEGGKRWCFCSYSNDWDAKTRTGIDLPEDCSLDKMVDILPKALAAAVDRGSASAAPSVDKAKAEADAKAALAAKRAATATAKPKEKPAETPPPKDEREAIADFHRLIANYEVTPDEIMAYLASNPKVVARFGSIEGIAFEDLPDPIVSWLTKGMEVVSENIKNNR